eukprot:gnl/TRDRNA2_/TRDRNA2_90740_c0_seq1.p1 gnl/TRDRNA2_/TRDRNA2_90740_c0~~gnl/TRDRNA2_/TRDRNA2_90740_c0_seq1.p1  ORF type:complete len:586 (-),score=55.69 gnl/TRDRNA2_/TRDRNA2_90740_c0_seq1:322-2079(-)
MPLSLAQHFSTDKSADVDLLNLRQRILIQLRSPQQHDAPRAGHLGARDRLRSPTVSQHRLNSPYPCMPSSTAESLRAGSKGSRVNSRQSSPLGNRLQYFTSAGVVQASNYAVPGSRSVPLPGQHLASGPHTRPASGYTASPRTSYRVQPQSAGVKRTLSAGSLRPSAVQCISRSNSRNSMMPVGGSSSCRPSPSPPPTRSPSAPLFSTSCSPPCPTEAAAQIHSIVSGTKEVVTESDADTQSASSHYLTETDSGSIAPSASSRTSSKTSCRHTLLQQEQLRQSAGACVGTLNGSVPPKVVHQQHDTRWSTGRIAQRPSPRTSRQQPCSSAGCLSRATSSCDDVQSVDTCSVASVATSASQPSAQQQRPRASSANSRQPTAGSDERSAMRSGEAPQSASRCRAKGSDIHASTKNAASLPSTPRRSQSSQLEDLTGAARCKRLENARAFLAAVRSERQFARPEGLLANIKADLQDIARLAGTSGPDGKVESPVGSRALASRVACEECTTAEAEAECQPSAETKVQAKPKASEAETAADMDRRAGWDLMQAELSKQQTKYDMLMAKIREKQKQMQAVRQEQLERAAGG